MKSHPIRCLTLLVSSAAILCALAAGGCESGGGDKSNTAVGNSPTDPKTPLYFRLGGEEKIEVVCGELVDRLAKNPKIDLERKGSAHPWNPTPENVKRLKILLTEFVCVGTGGPQKYTGRDMKTAHKGMTITEAEFSAAADDLVAVLDKHKVPQREKDELMAIVASTKPDIVGQ